MIKLRVRGIGSPRSARPTVGSWDALQESIGNMKAHRRACCQEDLFAFGVRASTRPHTRAHNMTVQHASALGELGVQVARNNDMQDMATRARTGEKTLKALHSELKLTHRFGTVWNVSAQ